MSIEVGTLVARLKMDDSDFERGEAAAKKSMTGLEQSAKSTSTQISTSFKGASQQVEKMSAAYQTASAAQKRAAMQMEAAERQLSAVRKNSASTAEEVRKAEVVAETARARVATTSVRAKEAIGQLAAAQRKASGDAEQLGRANEKASSAIGGVALKAKDLAIAAGAGFGIAGVVTFLKNATMAASDLAESQNGVDVIFGKSAKTVYDFASGAAKSIGMSNLAAREAATSFGAYAKIAGLSGDESAKFAVKMATLAGDMASFKNTTPEEAIESLGAAFRGESDPIEKYNVLLNESVLKNRAMKDGLISNTSEALDPAIRVQAAYNEILAQTNHMQGDFEKTSGSFSNRVKMLQADFMNTSAAIGDKLMPVAQGFVTLLSGPGMGALSGFGDVLGVVAKLAGTLASTFSGLPGPLQAAIGGIVATRIASAALGTEIGSKLTDRVKTGATAIGVYGVQARDMAGTVRTRLVDAFSAAGGGAEGFGNKMRAAGTMTANFARTVGSGLLGVMGGVPGILVAAATVGLGMWAAKSAEAKQRTQELESATTDVAKALNTSKGAYSDVGGAAARAALEQVKMADGVETLGAALDRLGISSRAAAAGLAGNKKELADTKARLKELADEERQRDMERGGGGNKGFGSTALGQLINYGGSRDKANEKRKLEAEYAEMEEAIKRQQESLKRVAAEGGDVVFSTDKQTAAVGAMAAAMEKFKENTDGAAAGVKILSSALDQLMGDQLTVEDSMVQWEAGVQALRDAAAGVNGPLYDMNGNLNAANASVRTFYEESKNAATNIHEVAAATFEQTGSLQAVKDAVTPLYDSFVQMAQAAGIPQPEIDKLIAKLGIIPTDVAITVSDNFPHRTELAELLRGKVVEIPDEKTIIVNDNSPEVVEKMKTLGLNVRELPDGRIEVTTNAAEAGAEIDFEATRQRYAEIRVTTKYDADAWAATGTSDSSGQAVGHQRADRNANGSIRVYGNGGIDGPLPSQAIIQRGWGNGLVQWAEGETGDEAYIPLSPSKRPRSKNILREVADRFGYGLVPMADGGIVESLVALGAAKAPALQVTDSYRAGTSDWHGAGQAVDFSNGSGNTDEMLAWANYLADNHQADLKELIYDDPRFTRNIKDGQIVSRDFYAGAGDHTNHVHVAAAKALAEAGKASAADTRTDKQKVADAIVAEGRRRGISDKGIKIALAAGLAESDLQDLPDIPNSEYDSAGAFQQRPSMGWGPAGQGVAQDANDFYDRLVGIDYENMDPAMAAQSVQRSAFSDGSNYRARLAEADQVFADSNSRSAAAPSDASSSAQSVSVQDVRVTNWPASLESAGAQAEERPARASLVARVFANGGFEDHSPQIANTFRVFGEPETGGEAYIPLSPSKRARSLQLWAETGRRLGVAGYADGGLGGFGGYSGPDRTDSMKPKNWYQALALGTGIGFTALSGLSGIASMAASGTVDLSNLMPKFDTGSNSIPGLSEAFQQLSKQLEELIEAARDGKPVNLKVDVDSQTGAANVAFTRTGL